MARLAQYAVMVAIGLAFYAWCIYQLFIFFWRSAYGN
jgi:hypothetical protein